LTDKVGGYTLEASFWGRWEKLLESTKKAIIFTRDRKERHETDFPLGRTEEQSRQIEKREIFKMEGVEAGYWFIRSLKKVRVQAL